MKKLKPLELNENKLTRNNDSNLSNILNKISLNQTGTTDYSLSQVISQKDINKKKACKSQSKPLINKQNPTNENKKLKNKRSDLDFNKSNLPTNVNAFYYLIYDNLFGSCESLNWALGLRLADKKATNVKSINNINEPTFYLADEKKYVNKKIKEGKYLLNELNPDFGKIKHLIYGRTKGNINYSQFTFSSCLRNYWNKNEAFKEKEKKFKITPLPDVKGYKYKAKNLSPITTAGIDNLNKIEKYIPKNYQITYENTKVGNDNIKKKVLSINRSYTLCGFGDCLNEQKYNNKFREVNIFANKDILNTTTNPISKFELGLRNYKGNNIQRKNNNNL